MQHEHNQGFDTYTLSSVFLITLSNSSRPDPRIMKWETNGELAPRDLSALVSRLLDVEESDHHSNELTRLGTKYEDSE